MSKEFKKSISIVYSTRNSDKKYQEHVRRTSGLFNNIEIIEYENPNFYSLTELYNKGLDESKNDIVVFIHDDLIFNQNDWGKVLLRHFNNTDYGILGVAGTTDLAENGVWWHHSNRMIGQVKHLHNNKIHTSVYSNNFGKETIPVCIIDGLFMAVDKTKIKSRFNEEIGDFHFYDISFSLENYLSNVKIGVIFDIDLTHKSIGEVKESWHKNREKFVNLYKDKLPVSLKVNDIVYKNTNEVVKQQPKVSVIIPTKNNIEMLFDCLNSYLSYVKYSNYEILVADTGSDAENLVKIENFIKDVNQKLNKELFKLIKFNYYNFARVNNEVVKKYCNDTDLLLFSNNDIKLLNDCVSKFVKIYNENKHNVGTIGGRLYFKDNTIQHSSIVAYRRVKEPESILFTHYGFSSYYTYIADVKKNVLGNTAALMLISKNLFNDIGGYNEEYIECFEDLQLNLSCILKDKINIFDGTAVAYHYESQTRNNNEEKLIKQNLDYKQRLLPFVQSNIKELERYIMWIN